MKMKDINHEVGYFDRYISLVKEEELLDALEKSLSDLEHLDMAMLKGIGSQVYQPGKWTIKDLFQHILDTERVMTYRTLRFARKDSTALAGYDEDMFAANANAESRELDDILTELKTVRTATIYMFRSFDEATLRNIGVCFNQNMSVLALGFMLAGHQIHHLNIINERYAYLA